MTRLIVAALLACTSVPATAAEVDVSAYPELAPDVLLPPIIAELKRMLKDPYSIRDLVLCPATKVKLKDGKPTRWYVRFSLNAKNGFGGYGGVTTYGAAFRDGRISGGISATQFGSGEGLDRLFNNMIAKQMATCPTVPDEKVQQLLSPGASIYRTP